MVYEPSGIVALLYEILQLGDEVHRAADVVFAPASVGSGVARGPYGVHSHQQRVVVAVILYAHKVEIVARRFALGPQLVAAAAPERHLSGADGLLVGFLVHKAEHQDVLCRVVLDYGRNQSAHLFKVYCHSLTFIFSLLR